MIALYITASPKKEADSASKTAGRLFIDAWMRRNPGVQLQQLDLYDVDIPRVNERLMTGRAALPQGEDFDGLTPEEKAQVQRIDALCGQFIAADRYIIAAPMWSTSFPAILKQYIDCVIINGKTISITPENVSGLLDDKERRMVYIQSSGGVYPRILDRVLNHGEVYMKDVFKFLGIAKFDAVMVEGVDMTDVGLDAALEKAASKLDKLAQSF